MEKYSIYEKNLEVIKKRLPPCYSGVLEYKSVNNENNRVFIEESENNEKIVAVNHDNRIWYLNSKYDAAEGTKSWMNSFESINFRGIVIMCGMSNLMYARELLKKLGKDNILIIYEPDPDILIKVLEEIDVSDVLGDFRTFLFSEKINMTFLRQYLRMLFEYERINYSRFVVLPNYNGIYKNNIEMFTDLCQSEIVLLEATNNTAILLGEEMNNNHIDNIWYSIFSSSINELKNEIDKINIKNIPCIIVAAGPSLDKNIDILKQAQKKSLIIAVDSAIKALLAQDIIPDLLVTVDSHKPMTLFENERILDIPLVVCMQSRVELLQKHKGKQFMFASTDYMKHIYNHFNKELETLSTGGSVANNAFSLAKFLGFKTIILVGQDLAFTDNKKHVGNVYNEKAIGEDSSEQYIEIEGQDGNPILTFPNFKLYRDWFEAEIKDNPEINVINATEGGAKIHGAEITTLKEAIGKCCIYDVDFDKAIAATNDSFSSKQKVEFYEMLESMTDKLENLRKKLKNGIRDYNKFYELIRNGKNHTQEFKRVLESIEKVNYLDKIEPLMEFVMMYAKEDEHNLGQNIYDVDDSADIKSEGKEIADRGIAMLNAYIRADEKVIDRVNYVLNNIVDKKRISELHI